MVVVAYLGHLPPPLDEGVVVVDGLLPVHPRQQPLRTEQGHKDVLARKGGDEKLVEQVEEKEEEEDGQTDEEQEHQDVLDKNEIRAELAPFFTGAQNRPKAKGLGSFYNKAGKQEQSRQQECPPHY